MQAERRQAFVRASSRLTHTDPRAFVAALAVAEAAAWAARQTDPAARPGNGLLASLRNLAPEDSEWNALLARLEQALASGRSVLEFAQDLGLARGVTGYAYHTVPVALFAWMRHAGDFRASLEAALDCGGDTDTVGAILGGLAGAHIGAEGIPPEWIRGICDWPRSVRLLEAVAARLAAQQAEGRPLGPVPYAWPVIPLRNILFLAIVLAHGFRRLLPPY